MHQKDHTFTFSQSTMSNQMLFVLKLAEHIVCTIRRGQAALTKFCYEHTRTNTEEK